MKQLRSLLQGHLRVLALLLIGLIGLAVLLTYKLGSLIGGLHATELAAANQALGFHGIASNPLYLPLKIVRSVVFVIWPDHGQALTRLPNVLFGAVAVIAHTWLIQLWHGRRTAVLCGILFACSAWTLHVSRFASFDVVYLLAIPILLLGQALLKRYPANSLVLYKVIGSLCLFLYVPGLVWLILPTIIAERKLLLRSWKVQSRWWQRTGAVLLPLLLIPPLIYKLAVSSTLLKSWAGLPEQFASISHIGKELLAVPVHLFIRGPQYPELWLGRMPILDIFMLALAVIGVYVYIRHLDSSRTRLLISYAAIGTVLIALSGPVSLSLLVPLVFVVLGMGVTYLLHEWLKVFPNNPLPRTLGIGLVLLAVLLSGTLNVRAYFVAWPHNTSSAAVFRQHR